MGPSILFLLYVNIYFQSFGLCMIGRVSILEGYSYGCKVSFKYIKICFQNFKQYSIFKIPQKLKRSIMPIEMPKLIYYGYP
jgi:xanthine/uracil permease